MNAPAQDTLERRKLYRLTDVGNAERLVDAHGRDLRWVSRWKCWLVWDGRRWYRDERGDVERRAKAVIRQLYQDVADAPAEQRPALIKHAMNSEQSSRLEAMIKLSRSEPGIAIGHDELDQQAMHFTVRNGTVDLTTGRLRPHDRGHLGTKLVDIDYDEHAECPTWLATLSVLFDGDQLLIDYLRRAVGYSLTGNTSEQVLHLCYGTGANGKSTVLDVLAQITGEYGMQSDFQTFLDTGTRSGPRNDVARLNGARLVRSSEVGENKKLNEGLIKSLTGGDIVSARFLYSEDFEFKPQFKLWLAANHKPVIRGTDYAIWRRMRLIPFERTIAPEHRDDGLPSKLAAELPGILNWAIQGCQEWLAEGLKPPERVLAATDSYRLESDVIGAFIEDECEIGAGYEAKGGELYQCYKRWSHDNGEYSVTATAFGRRLDERGYTVTKSGGFKWRKGLRLSNKTSGNLFNSSDLYGGRAA